ncbi:hypothetical protein PG994_002401 [Apiospora phragmitis]|uniref:DUF7580 domain-containing protein n=1 Tax=Apiospora phragmitis TaxID=2905665 RepID=A0ABR1WW83_9PEZI
MATFIQWQGQLDTLLFRLKNQKLSFFFDILELLRSASIEDVVENPDITETECLLILHDAKTGAYLQAYLGQHYDAFLEILRRYEDCLKLIARKLKHVRRLPKVTKDDLLALLAANPPGYKGFAFQQRISFTIEKTRLTQLIEELNEDRLSLKTIIKGMRSQQEHTTNEPSKDSHKLANLLGQVQGHAQSLFSAVYRSCECSCPRRHRVLLQLHNRIPPTKVRRNASSRKTNPATFKLVVGMGDVLLEAIVQAGAASISPQPTKTGLSNVHFSLSNDCFGLLDGQSHNSRFLGDSLTLAEVLRRGSDNETARISYKEQTFLALDIARSVVQLRETLWLGSPFTSHALLVIIPAKKNLGFSTKPFVEQTPESTKSAQVSPDPEAVLCELAILLLELWHHRPLELWCANMEEMDISTPHCRLTAAISWVKATSERIPLHHLDAIEGCIALCCGRQRLWGDQEFLKIYCENVIIPLQESCRAWDAYEGWSEAP